MTEQEGEMSAGIPSAETEEVFNGKKDHGEEGAAIGQTVAQTARP